MRYVAFLRGINTGGHRVTNAELCGHIEALGFKAATGFLASGNVIFETRRTKDVAGRIERGLHAALGYEVPTMLRTDAEVASIAGREVFSARLLASWGKEHVWFLAEEPSPDARKELLTHGSKDDRLEVIGRELHWLPRGSVLDSRLTLARVERCVGTATARTMNTVRRLAKVLETMDG